ncbi:MAG TPA: D-alanine--D-alanine ligase [Abditibacteriaceae bacterium]|nr:D-alanine--D-alanine ligase [Abditibacteriaceae bacterium]
MTELTSNSSLNNGSSPIRVALLLGGDSSERAISIKTGQAMRAALNGLHFHVTTFDVGKIAPLESVPETTFLSWSDLAATLRAGNFDVVLPALHGGWGEDGTLQALLETAALPYVGTPPRGSTIAMDKQLCKLLMREEGLIVPRGVTIEDEKAAPPFDGACVVKPNNGGSSVGVTILKDTPDVNMWRAALQSALSDGGAALVEETIEGIEITAPVVGEGESARSLPLIEVVPQSAGGFYDFEAKYATGGSQHLIPPRLSGEIQKQISEHALQAHRALGCRGVSRSDFIVTRDGTPYFLEINTLPGMTETSLVPDAARAAGISFPQLIQMLIESALSQESSTRLQLKIAAGETV